MDPLEVVLCNNAGRGEVTASDTRRAGNYFTFAGNIPMEKLSVQEKMSLRPSFLEERGEIGELVGAISIQEIEKKAKRYTSKLLNMVLAALGHISKR